MRNALRSVRVRPDVSSTSRVFSFPNPVNEVAARSVAAGVAMLGLLTIVLATVVGHAWLWLTAALTYGFLARVLTGPTLSPLGQFATRVAAPRIGRANLVPGPPKRFAQAIGLTLTGAALILVALNADTAVLVLLSMLVVAATLESAFAFCIGCRIFGFLMRIGLIPEETCAACADISLRNTQPA